MARSKPLYALLSIVMLAAGMATLPTPLARAQVAPPPSPAPLQLQCCRCLEGKVATVHMNTGSGAKTVQWRVSGPDVPAGATAFTIASNPNGQWTARLPPAGWVQPSSGNGGRLHPAGTYRYEVTVATPKYCTIPMNFVLEGSAAGDDEVKVYVDDFTQPIGYTPLGPVDRNGVEIGSAGIEGWGFTRSRVISYFGRRLGPGTHTLRVEVKNFSFGSHGVLVQARVRTICPGRGST